MTDIKNKGETGKGGNLSAAEKKERIDSLIKTLNEASRAYYDEAQEIMTNFEYDALYDELQALEEMGLIAKRRGEQKRTLTPAGRAVIAGWNQS